MIGIYRIINQINGKCYIGQSVNIKRRWKDHKCIYKNQNAHEYDYYLYRAMRKYGIENFKFEVVEECECSDLDDREKYWISKFDSYRNGYNQTEGGENTHRPVKINPEQLDKIDLLLAGAELKIQDIADMVGVSYEMIQGINTGRYWHRDNIEYPIGKYIHNNHINHCIDCGKEIDIKATRCRDCYIKSQRKIERPNIFVLLKLITEISFVKIGKIFGVTDNTIRKWCDSYGIPKKKKDVINYIKSNHIVFDNKDIHTIVEEYIRKQQY